MAISQIIFNLSSFAAIVFFILQLTTISDLRKRARLRQAAVLDPHDQKDAGADGRAPRPEFTREQEGELRRATRGLGLVTSALILVALAAAALSSPCGLDLDLAQGPAGPGGGACHRAPPAWQLVGRVPWELAGAVGRAVSFVPRLAGEVVLAACRALGVPVPMWAAGWVLVAGALAVGWAGVPREESS